MACLKFDSLSLQRTANTIFCLLALAFIFQAIFNSGPFMAHGRKFPESSQANQKQNQDIEVKVRSMIGSRPPRCAGRCNSCGHCEAIQVPIAPFTRLLGPDSAVKSSRSSIVAYYRGDNYHSNYKPMCWKCKCGDLLFNP